MNDNPSPKQIIKDVMTMRNLVISMLDKTKKYYPLFKILTDKDYYNDEDLAYPNIKQLSEWTGLSYQSTRNLLVKGYKEIYLMTYDHPVQINSVKYIFYIKGFDNSINLNFSNLPVIPRIGEAINIYHFKALVGTDYFFVDDIQYEFNDQTQLIYLWLKTGSYNLYWHFKKHQAIEEGKLSTNNLFDLHDYQLRDKLGTSKY
jgi:hypothetical protein